jgi:hypothetical protein
MKLINQVIEAGCQWFTPAILATQEAEIRRIALFEASPRQIVLEKLTLKKGCWSGSKYGP